MGLTSIYWIECQNKVIYVGKTSNPDHRLKKHFKGQGCQTTKRNKPVRLLECYEVEESISSLCEWEAVSHCERMYPDHRVYGGGRTREYPVK